MGPAVTEVTTGRVADVPFPRVFYALAARAFTGLVTLQEGGSQYTVWWKHGLVVDADSPVPVDQLGQVLAGAGLIDAGILEQLSHEKSEAPLRDELELLIELGALTGEGIVRGAAMGLAQRAARVFAPLGATYTIEPREHQRLCGGPLDARWIIYAGLRDHYDVARLERELQPLAGRAVRLSVTDEGILHSFGFGDGERKVLGLLQKGYWELGDLIAASGLRESMVMAVAYALVASDCTDVQPAEAVPRLRKRGSSQPPTPAAGNAQVREEVQKKLFALGAGADHFEVLEVERTASKEQIKAAYFQLAKTFHPDRAVHLKLEDMRPAIERIFAALSQAFATLSDDARRKDYLTVLAQGGEAAVRQKEDEEAAKAAQIISAEEQFRIGEMALRRQQWDKALESFKKALELNPDESEHHALMGWTIWASTPAGGRERVVGDVKRYLSRAIELNPRSAPAYYYLGQVSMQTGDEARAGSCFVKALDLRPGWLEAEREVRLLAMRRDKEKKTSGLFAKLRKK